MGASASNILVLSKGKKAWDDGSLCCPVQAEEGGQRDMVSLHPMDSELGMWRMTREHSRLQPDALAQSRWSLSSSPQSFPLSPKEKAKHRASG